MTLADLRTWLEPFAEVGALVPAAELLARLPLGDAEGRPAPAVEVPLTCNEIAKALDRTPACVRTWCRSGELRAHRLNGREWRVTREDLTSFLELDRQEPARLQTNAAPRLARSGLRSWRAEPDRGAA